MYAIQSTRSVPVPVIVKVLPDVALHRAALLVWDEQNALFTTNAEGTVTVADPPDNTVEPVAMGKYFPIGSTIVCASAVK